MHNKRRNPSNKTMKENKVLPDIVSEYKTTTLNLHSTAEMQTKKQELNYF